MEVSKKFKTFKTKKEQLLHNADLLLERAVNNKENYAKCEQVKIICGKLPVDITRDIKKKVEEKSKEYNKLEFEMNFDINAEIMLIFVLP